MDGIVKRVVMTVLLLLVVVGVTACGNDEPARPAIEVPEWARVAPEQIAEAMKHGVPVAFENDVEMRFVLIPSGRGLVGSLPHEPGQSDQFPEVRRQITIPRPFYVQMTEVTNAQYRRWRPRHDSGKSAEGPDPTDLQPATHVSRDDALGFAEWLCRRGSGHVYRLPTEVEWEYACRAGTTTSYWFGDALLPKHAAFRRGSGGTSEGGPALTGVRPVSSYAPNGWGVYDMHGNVWEWCADGPDAVLSGQPIRHEVFALRGGSWQYVQSSARSAYRTADASGWSSDDTGFRLVSTLPSPKGGE